MISYRRQSAYRYCIRLSSVAEIELEHNRYFPNTILWPIINTFTLYSTMVYISTEKEALQTAHKIADMMKKNLGFSILNIRSMYVTVQW